MASVPRTVGGAAIRSCHDTGELAGRLCASVGVGSMVYPNLGSGGFLFFLFYSMPGKERCSWAGGPSGHVSARGGGGSGGNPLEDAQHYPFHNSWSSFKMFDFEQKLYVS
jgi:hypothetical protein